jgi:uncharacterized protein (DUF983 family)
VTVHAPIQTSEQLGVSNARMLWRGLLRRCPACAERHTHASWFTMLPECPQCSLKFERIFGHSLGYIGLNTVVTFTATFFVILIGSLITRPDIAVVPLILAALVTAVGLPLAFVPSAHTTWTAIDLIARPLEPGEIDPRFVKVDPEAGAWLDDT